MQVLLVEFKNGHVVRFTEARRTPGDNLKHGLERARRSADDLENLRCSRLLFLRVVQFAAKPRDFSFPTGNGGKSSENGAWRPERCDRVALVLQGGGAAELIAPIETPDTQSGSMPASCMA
jgi:hypothetical protein